jgi:hypothetical protein
MILLEYIRAAVIMRDFENRFQAIDNVISSGEIEAIKETLKALNVEQVKKECVRKKR